MRRSSCISGSQRAGGQPNRAGIGEDFADRVEADIHPAGSDQIEERFCRRRQLGFGPDRSGDVERSHQLAHQNAGGSAERRVRVGDDFGAQEREQEGIDRADVGFGIAFADECPDADLGNHDLAAGNELSLLLQLFGRRFRQDRDIGVFTPLDAGRQSPNRPIVDRKLVS